MKTKFYTSVPVLILANVIPLVGVIFFGWDVFQVVVLYWLETFVIGAYTVVKILKSRKPVVDQSAVETVIDPKNGNYSYDLKSNGDYVTEFTGKFLAFLGIQLLFIVLIFLPSHIKDNSFNLVVTDSKQFLPSFLALVVSHGYSYFANFIGKREYLAYSPKEIILQAFSRIILMDIAFLAGMFISIQFGYNTTIWVLIALVTLKIIFDIFSHVFERIRGHEGIEEKAESFVYDTIQET